MITDFLLWLSRRRTLSAKVRMKIVTELIHRGGALPLHATITEDGGKTLIRGVPLDVSQATALKESAEYALENSARKTVREQIRYEAIKHGIHTALTPEQTYFAKAALWVIDQEEEMLNILAGRSNSTL